MLVHPRDEYQILTLESYPIEIAQEDDLTFLKKFWKDFWSSPNEIAEFINQARGKEFELDNLASDSFREFCSQVPHRTKLEEFTMGLDATNKRKKGICGRIRHYVGGTNRAHACS